MKGEEYEVHDYNSSAGHPSVNVLVLEDDYAPVPENYRTVDFDTDGGKPRCLLKAILIVRTRRPTRGAR